MERQEVFEKLTGVFEDVFDIEDVELTDATSADDIEEWDSLSHVQLIVAIEKAFKTKFTSLEIMKWKNVGELVDSILSKC
jgi:acyl carrier protein